MDDRGHEHVAYYRDERTGLRCIVAVYDTRRGPAVGGTRMLPYDGEAAALEDALRLSEAMAYKTAAAELPLGGGKAVIVGDPDDKTDDLRVIQETTGNVGGAGGAEGADVTAAGVGHGLRACFAERDGDSSLAGRRVAVQGVGKVGRALVARLVDADAEVVVADVDEEAIAAVTAEFGVRSVAPDAIYDEPCDAFAPCALGGVLDDGTIPRLRCDVVCGSANNPLAERRHADALAEQGILYAPDYVVSAGGLVSGVVELEGGDPAAALERVAAVRDRLMSMFETAREEGITPLAAADRFAEARMAEGGEPTLF